MSHPPAGREHLEHAQARRLIDAYLVDELPRSDAARLAAHVEGCPACAAELGGTTRLLALLGSLPVPAPAPDLDERIFTAAVRDRARRHEHRSWLADLRVQVFRGAVRTTGTLVAAVVTVAFLGSAFVLAAGFITQVAMAPQPPATVAPDMTPTLTPTPVPATAPATAPASPALTVAPTATPAPSPEPTPVPTATPAPSPEPTPVPTATPAPTPEPTPTPEFTEEPTATPAPTPSPSVTAEPTPTPSPTPVPTEKPRRTPPPSASPSPTPTPAPTEAPSPTLP